MDDETFRKCCSAIYARIEFIRCCLCNRSPIEIESKMVGIQRIVCAISQRHLKEVRSESKNFDSLLWFSTYLKSSLRVGLLIQDSIKNKSLIPRDICTHIPLMHTEIQEWLDIDLVVAMKNSKLRAECASRNPVSPEWEDEICYPPGCVSLADAEAWAVSTGIATAAELRELLGMKSDLPSHDDQAPAPADPEPPKTPYELATFGDLINYRRANPVAPWHVEALRLLSDEEARRKSSPGASGVRQSLALDLGVSVARVGDLIRRHKDTLCARQFNP